MKLKLKGQTKLVLVGALLVVVLGFVAPWLLSAPSTPLVLLGVGVTAATVWGAVQFVCALFTIPKD